MTIEPTDWIDRYPDDTPDRLNALFERLIQRFGRARCGLQAIDQIAVVKL